VVNVSEDILMMWSLWADWLIHVAVGAYRGFCSMKRLGVFILPLEGMLVHCRSLGPHFLLGFPNNSLVPIYTPGWREAVRELHVLLKNTTQSVSLTRASTRTAQSGDRRTSHEATVPLIGGQKEMCSKILGPFDSLEWWIGYNMYLRPR